MPCCAAHPAGASSRAALSPPRTSPHPTAALPEPEPEPEPEVELVPAAAGSPSGLDRAAAELQEVLGAAKLTDAEQAAVLALRRRLPPDDDDGLPSAEMLLRFLRATSFGLDVKHRDPARRGDFFAERLLRRHLAWRQRWRPEQLTARDCQTALDSGAARFLGVGPLGNPVVWAQVSQWNPQDYPRDPEDTCHGQHEFVRYCAFFMVLAEGIMRTQVGPSF